MTDKLTEIKEYFVNAELEKIDHTDLEYLMKIDEFLNYAQNGSLIDEDGMGVWATSTHYLDSGDYIYPSEIARGTVIKPVWATHILWYNK